MTFQEDHKESKPWELLKHDEIKMSVTKPKQIIILGTEPRASTQWTNVLPVQRLVSIDFQRLCLSFRFPICHLAVISIKTTNLRSKAFILSYNSSVKLHHEGNQGRNLRQESRGRIGLISKACLSWFLIPSRTTYLRETQPPVCWVLLSNN